MTVYVACGYVTQQEYDRPYRVFSDKESAIEYAVKDDGVRIIEILEFVVDSEDEPKEVFDTNIEYD